MDTRDKNVQEARELLPWYANGTLDAQETEQVERELDGHEGLRAEAEELGELLDATGADTVVPMLTHARLERVMERVDAEPQSATPLRGMLGRLRQAWFGWTESRAPMLLAAAACLAFAVVLVSPHLTQDSGVFETLTDGTDPVVPIAITVAPGVSDAEAQAMFREMSLTAERQEDGVYIVGLPEDGSFAERYRIVEALRADRRVADAVVPPNVE